MLENVRWVPWTILGGAIALATVTLAFYRRQRGGAMGGRMSPAKALWLNFAVTYWFIICPLLAIPEALGQPWRLILGLHGAHFWLRGFIELWMLYISKNWRPRYGIFHNFLSISLILLIALFGPSDSPQSPLHWLGLWATITLTLSMILEIGYAWAFNRLVCGQTTGDEGIWFADAEQALFRRVNNITAIFNCIVYASVVGIVWQLWLAA